MNDNSSTPRAQSRIPSDDQMDTLLRDFFRLEVPAELNQPFRRGLSPAVAMATLTVATENPVKQPSPRSVRLLTVAASVAAMAMAVLFVVSGNNSSSSNPHNDVTGVLQDPAARLSSDKDMLVSPEGDSRVSRKVVGPNGETLEETEGIELYPQK